MLLVGVGDAVAAVAVSVDLDGARPGAFAGLGQEVVHCGPHFVEVVAVALAPLHVVAGGALGEFAGRRAGLAGAHRVAVVLDHENDRQVPEGGEVVGLVDGALVDGAVAHERHRGPLQALVLDGVGEAGAERDLAADDAVPAPEIAGRIKIMHRAALALGAAGGLAVELGHERLGVHPDGDGVAVIAVRRDDVVVRAHQGAGADGDRLLADVKVEEAADLLRLIGAEAALFETPDAHHLAMQLDLVLARQLRVDRSRGVIRAAGGGGRAFGLGSGSRFLAHGRSFGWWKRGSVRRRRGKSSGDWVIARRPPFARR